MEQEMMRAVCFTSKGNFKIKDIPRPTVKSGDDVLIKVLYAGLCGDDVRVLCGDMGGFQESHVMGDEMSGVIVDSGEYAQQAGKAGIILIFLKRTIILRLDVL